MNRMIRQAEVSELKHYGVLGMKWGKRLASRKTNKLEGSVTRTVRRFDRGKSLKDGEVSDLSTKVRTHKYKLDKRIKRAQRFLDKGVKADAKAIVNRYNRDPEKRKAVKEYMDDLKTNIPKLDELRMQLIDIKL